MEAHGAATSAKACCCACGTVLDPLRWRCTRCTLPWTSTSCMVIREIKLLLFADLESCLYRLCRCLCLVLGYPSRKKQEKPKLKACHLFTHSDRHEQGPSPTEAEEANGKWQHYCTCSQHARNPGARTKTECGSGRRRASRQSQLMSVLPLLMQAQGCARAYRMRQVNSATLKEKDGKMCLDG